MPSTFRAASPGLTGVTPDGAFLGAAGASATGVEASIGFTRDRTSTGTMRSGEKVGLSGVSLASRPPSPWTNSIVAWARPRAPLQRSMSQQAAIAAVPGLRLTTMRVGVGARLPRREPKPNGSSSSQRRIAL